MPQHMPKSEDENKANLKRTDEIGNILWEP